MKIPVIVTLLALLATSCGGTSHELLIFDAAPPGVTSVVLTIASAEVHVDGGDEKSSKAADDASIDDDRKWRRLEVHRAIDLMQHEGESAAEVLGQLDLPEGKVTQLRLSFDTAAQNTATYNGSDCELDMSRLEARSLKINHVFKAFDTDEGDEQKMYIHLDLERSLTASGGCFALEPKLELRKVKVDGKAKGL